MKKWTYLVAAGMMLGATPVFTGCIDNDEPEGISILRGAKAELLKAKASVELARVEQVKAEAALKLAEAEVQKAEAARIQAIADYEAAKAKEMEYKAELANIQNEEERAKLENQIKIYAEQRAAAERAAQKAAAELEVQLMSLKAQLAQQEALYEQALKDLALAKNTLTQAQQAHLAKWTTALETAQTDVKQKAAAYEKAVKKLAELTKTMDKEEARESYLRDEKKAVEDAKIALDAAIEARDLAKEYAEKDFAEIEKWEEERLAIEAELKALDKKLADLDVEKTKLETSTKDEATAVEKARKAYEDLTGYVWADDKKEFELTGQSKEEIKLDDIVIAINEPALELGISGTITDSYYYSEYLRALQEGNEFNLESKNLINALRYNINNIVLDPNKKAWTEDEIADHNRSLENLQRVVDSKKKQWEQAVKAFKGLEYGNPTDFDGFDKVEEAVVAYNEAVKKYNADNAEYNTFYTEKLKPVEDAHNEKMAEIQAVYDKARIDNEAEYDKTCKEIDENIGALEKAMKVAWANFDKLYAQYLQIENPKEGDDKAHKAAYEAYEKAEAAWTKASDEANGYDKDNGDGTTTRVIGSKEKAETLRNNKNTIAEKDKALAVAKEMEAYFKANPNGALESEYRRLEDAMYANPEGSFYVLDKAYRNVRIALSNFNTNLAFNPLTSYTVIDKARYYQDEETGNLMPQEVKAEDVARIDRSSLKNYICKLSEELYGYNNADRLVELTAEDIKKEIETKFASDYPEYPFVPYFMYEEAYHYRYGRVGKIEYYKSLISRGTASLQPETKTKIENLIKEMDAHLANIDAQIAAYTADVVEPAEQAYTTAYTALMDKFAEVDKAYNEAKAQKYAKKPVYDKIVNAIATYVSQETTSEATTLADLKKELKAAYDKAVEDVYTKETAYINAKEWLQSVIDKTKDPVIAQQEAVAEAQKALEEAQAELQAASEALQAEIERISATAE